MPKTYTSQGTWDEDFGSPVGDPYVQPIKDTIKENTERQQAAPHSKEGETYWPPSVILILLVELFERFAYYGISVSFTNYMENMLEWSQAESNAAFNAFYFVSYGLTILGGVLADDYWGRFTTIAAACVAYTFGVACIAVSAAPFSWADYPNDAWPGFAIPGFIIGMFFMGLGTAGIKPNVSTMLAEQLIGADQRGLESAYRWFYFSINAGAVVGNGLTPFLHKLPPKKEVNGITIGTTFWLSFSVPAALFFVVVVIFVAGKKTYVLVQPSGSVVTKGAKVLWSCTKNRLRAGCSPVNPRATFIEYCDVDIRLKDDQFVTDLGVVLRICKLLVVFPFYWLIYNQTSTNFVSQAKWLRLPSWLALETMNVFNPIMLIIAIPFMDRIFFPFMRKKGYLLPRIQRMVIGFFIAGCSMMYAGGLQCFVSTWGYWDDNNQYKLFHNHERKIWVWWQIPPYPLIAMSEIFANVTAYEFVFSQTPSNMRSIAMSLYLCTTAGGSLLGIIISPLIQARWLAQLFFAFGAIVWVFGIMFYYTFRNYDVAEVRALTAHSSIDAGNKLTEKLVSERS